MRLLCIRRRSIDQDSLHGTASLMKLRYTLSIAGLLFLGLLSGRADAGVILGLTETSTGISYSLSGSLKSSTLGTAISSSQSTSGLVSSINPSEGSVLAIGDSANYDVYSVNVLGAAASHGSGGAVDLTGSSSGDLFGLFVSGSTAQIWLPTGYSGDSLSANGRWAGSLVSLGLSVGTYLTTIETTPGLQLSMDHIVLNIASEVPEPTLFPIFMSISGCIFFFRRSRTRRRFSYL